MKPTPTGATPTEPSFTALAGTPYRALGRLGRGGMGEVLDAEHAALGKRVVVKLLHPELEARRDLVDRMRIEAQALARLDHPNLVEVTDFGQTADGRTYLVMERLWGSTLREELAKRGALPPLEAIELACQVLAGLGAAHEAGIVHRDIKLDNLFLCAPSHGRRRLKVLDFGIAKVLAGDAGERSGGAAPAPLAFPTEEGVAIGTPRFFAPEQARGWKVDARTDVYATGVVLYALVAGRGPFDDAPTLYALTRAHALEPPPPPSRFAPQPLPPDLEAAILRALEKKPDDRFPSAAAFAAELEAIAARLRARPESPRWLDTETMPPLEAPARPEARVHERRALEARATVRMPELAEAQAADRRAREARAVAPARPSEGSPAPAAPPLHPSLPPPGRAPAFEAPAFPLAPAAAPPRRPSVAGLVLLAVLTAALTATIVLLLVLKFAT